MRIVLQEKKIEKPLEQPIMVMNKGNEQKGSREYNYPVPVGETLPEVYEAPKKKQENKKVGSFRFTIANEPLETMQIKPVSSTKNDKVSLLIDTLSDSYSEMYQMINQFDINKDGIHIPTQDRFFFETAISNNQLTNYATVKQSQKEYMKQNLNFAWHKAPVLDVENDIYDFNIESSQGYEFTLRHTPALSLSTDMRLKEKPLREYLEQSKMLRKNEKVLVQFGIQPSEPEWFKDGIQSQKDLSKRIQVSEASKKKLSMNAFDCCLRVIVISDKEQRREMIARGIIMAIKQLNGDNELVEQRVKSNKMEKWIEKYVKPRKIKTYFKFNKRFLLTKKEIAHFVKLPPRNLQKDFELDVNERDELKVDKSLRKKNGILIGHSEEKGKKVAVRLPVDNLDLLLNTSVISGSPRMGKDTFFVNLLVESVNTLDVGAFVPDVIDEKGNGRGMSDSIRDSLPPEKIVDLNLGDYNNPIYFGLEDVAGLIGVNGMNVIADSFVKVLGLEDTTESQELCSLIAKANKCNIYKMYCCLRSKKYAKELYEELKEEDQLLAMEYKYEFLDAKKDKAINTIKTRLKMILGNPHFKHMMAQEPNHEIDFEKWIRERKVVLLRMKTMDIGEIGVRVLMYLISLKIFWIKKIIETDDPTYLVFNEPDQYNSEGFEELTKTMMTQSPKYRLGLFWLFHNPNQLPGKHFEIMKSSSINWYLFKNTNFRFYMDLREQLHPIEVETAMKTEKWETVFLPFINGKQLDPFFVKTLPPPKDRMRPFDNEHLTREHSRLYGRNVDDVREQIMKVEMGMYEEDKKSS